MCGTFRFAIALDDTAIFPFKLPSIAREQAVQQNGPTASNANMAAMAASGGREYMSPKFIVALMATTAVVVLARAPIAAAQTAQLAASAGSGL